MSRLPIGTFVNMATILIGSLIGLMLQRVFPENIQNITFQAVGLGILIIGIQMSLKLKDDMMLVFIFSLIIGGIIGEWIGLKELLESCAEWSRTNLHIGQKRFSEGLIAAFILFAASPMTIVGAIEEGLQNKRDLLLIKSALDGVTAIALASSYGGVGVSFSIIAVLLVQGGLTLLATSAKGLFTKQILAKISAVGGVLLIALAIKILGLGTFKVASLLPSLIVVILLSRGYSKLKVKL